MHDILSTYDGLRRPRLLIRAARIGVQGYRRDAHLRRHFGYGPLPRTASALVHLLDMEAAQNHLRLIGNAAYCHTRHVDLLIAMMGEARILRTAHVAPPVHS